MAPGEPPQEEVPEPVSDNDSEPYQEDDIPEEEEEDDEDDEDDDYEDDYKVGWSNPSDTPMLGHSRCVVGETLCCVCKQSPPSTQTQDKKDDDTEGTMPPYDPQTQELIDGKRDDKSPWLSLPSALSDSL